MNSPSSRFLSTVASAHRWNRGISRLSKKEIHGHITTPYQQSSRSARAREVRTPELVRESASATSCCLAQQPGNGCDGGELESGAGCWTVNGCDGGEVATGAGCATGNGCGVDHHRRGRGHVHRRAAGHRRGDDRHEQTQHASGSHQNCGRCNGGWPHPHCGILGK